MTKEYKSLALRLQVIGGVDYAGQCHEGRFCSVRRLIQAFRSFERCTYAIFGTPSLRTGPYHGSKIDFASRLVRELIHPIAPVWPGSLRFGYVHIGYLF